VHAKARRSGQQGGQSEVGDEEEEGEEIGQVGVRSIVEDGVQHRVADVEHDRLDAGPQEEARSAACPGGPRKEDEDRRRDDPHDQYVLRERDGDAPHREEREIDVIHEVVLEDLIEVHLSLM
jgi:hypothetical protein